MKRKTILIPAALILLAGVAATLAPAQSSRSQAGRPAQHAMPLPASGEDGEVIALEKAPPEVRDTAVKLARDSSAIKRVRRQKDDDGLVTFRVDYVEGSAACAALISGSGDVMETERSAAASDLPAAALAALKREYPGATLADVQIVTRTCFQLVVSADGRKHPVEVDAVGRIDDDSEGEPAMAEGSQKDEKPAAPAAPPKKQEKQKKH